MQEADTAEFERKRKEAEDLAESKTSKNRAKRQKKKERSKGKGPAGEDGTEPRGADGTRKGSDAPIKKRRLVNGKELVFRRQGEDSDGEEVQGDANEPNLPEDEPAEEDVTPEAPKVVDAVRIMIHEDD